MYKPGDVVYAKATISRTLLDEGEPITVATEGQRLVIKKFWTYTGGWEVANAEGFTFVATEDELRA